MCSKYRLFNATSNISSDCSYIENSSNPCKSLKDRILTTKDGFLFVLHLKRDSDHQQKTIFIPCILLWIVAYCSVHLGVDDFTNRNRISVTVLLALVTLFGATANTDDYPKTTYLKYIDVWFLFYLTSLFLIISHHIAIERLWNDDRKNYPSTNDVRNDIDGEERIKDRNTKKKKWFNKIGIICFPVKVIIFNIVYFYLMYR